MDIVKAIHPLCKREDCRFDYRGTGSTLIEWAPTYDKNGVRMDEGDPNITTHGYKCLTCGRLFKVSEQRKKLTVKEIGSVQNV